MRGSDSDNNRVQGWHRHVEFFLRSPDSERHISAPADWVPGVNHLGTCSRWAFAEFTDVFPMRHDFAQKVEAASAKMIDGVVGQ